MTEFLELIKATGLLNAILIVCIVMIWREWRKSEERAIAILTDQVKASIDMASKYSSFESAIRGLTDVIKKG